jgi:hypothetical protein
VRRDPTGHVFGTHMAASPLVSRGPGLRASGSSIWGSSAEGRMGPVPSRTALHDLE